MMEKLYSSLSDLCNFFFGWMMKEICEAETLKKLKRGFHGLKWSYEFVRVRGEANSLGKSLGYVLKETNVGRT